ncbi:MAG: hypothetical protein PHU77_00675, partial [Simplicispira sp.]|nr:hypothetical protein [Simplicispira sp.]
DGLEFTVGFWIADPENGALGLRSQINVGILQALRAHAIDIPYPQRVVHLPPAPVPLNEDGGLTALARTGAVDNFGHR